jgi:hypothetical protein
MKRKVAGLLLAASLAVGVGPMATAAHANTPTDPVLCFVVALGIIDEALSEYQAGHLAAAELREVLVGISSFLGDCLT